MSEDSFLSSVDSPFTFETHSFLTNMLLFAMVAPDPKSVLDRFMVEQITHCKDHLTHAAHELLTLMINDTHRSGSEPLFMCLERRASSSAYRRPFSYFTDHPDSATVLESIVKSLKEKLASLSTSVSSSSSLRDPSSDQHPIPLSTYQRNDGYVSIPPSPSTDTDGATVLESIVATLKEKLATLSTSVTRSNDSSSSLRDRSSDQLPIPLSTYQSNDESLSIPPSPLSLLDIATLKASDVVCSSMSSSSKAYRADDRFIGAKNIGDYAKCIHNIRQIRPQSLSLFELAVLANAVHNHDPLYSTLKSQCYWYTLTVPLYLKA